MSTQIQLTSPNQLKYLTVGEMREEIAALVGGDVDRYERRCHDGFLEWELQLIAEELQPDDDGTDLDATNRKGTYKAVCRWIGIPREEVSTTSYDCLDRGELKKLHRTLFDELEVGEVQR